MITHTLTVAEKRAFRRRKALVFRGLRHFRRGRGRGTGIAL
jgi:hypothetical protein